MKDNSDLPVVGEFYKVSFNQFLKDAKKTGFVDNETEPELVKLAWERIKLPTRATKGSAGYDFYLPFSFFLSPGKCATIPTGIRIQIQPGWFLGLMPRSGLGFKYGMSLLNTFGVIDSDYFFADNEGHIMAKVDVKSNMCLEEGDRFMQGILFPYAVTGTDPTLNKTRIGGFGSTGGS